MSMSYISSRENTLCLSPNDSFHKQNIMILTDPKKDNIKKALEESGYKVVTYDIN